MLVCSTIYTLPIDLHSAPNDNPSEHQGRVRSQPFREGVYYTHVHLSISLDYKFKKLLVEIYHDFKGKYNNIQPLFNTEDIDDDDEYFYVSLSRPLGLRNFQIKPFNKAIENITKKHKAITISFSDIDVLFNDNKTRAFIVLPIVAGYQELNKLLRDIDNGPIHENKQEPYYDPAILHTSIAWMLTTDEGFSENELRETTRLFTEKYTKRLRLLGAFESTKVNVKVSKQVYTHTLSN